MRLLAVTTATPPGALELLVGLGDGENGFGGTPVGRDPGKLDDWLDYCVHIATAPPLSDDFLAQMNYWIIDDTGFVVGLVRIFPRINQALLNHGGHLGYYVAPAYRSKGYGKAAFRLALDRLRREGVKRALVTVESHNSASLSLVQAFGGVEEGERIDDETGRALRRFWLDTACRTKIRQKAS